MEQAKRGLLLTLFLCLLSFGPPVLKARFATHPSGLYTVQGCHMCSQDTEIFCCRCPLVRYDEAFPFSDLLGEKREMKATRVKMGEGPSTDFRGVTKRKIQDLYTEWLHRSMGYVTICIPTVYARQCDGQLMLCGDKLICGTELERYRAAGYC